MFEKNEILSYIWYTHESWEKAQNLPCLHPQFFNAFRPSGFPLALTRSADSVFKKAVPPRMQTLSLETDGWTGSVCVWQETTHESWEFRNNKVMLKKIVLYIYIYTCIHVYKYILKDNIYIYIHVYIYIYIYINMLKDNIYIYIYKYIYIYIHMYTYIYI